MSEIKSENCLAFLKAESKRVDVLDNNYPCKHCEKFGVCDNGDG